MSTPWADAPIVFVQRVTCPHCNTTETPITVRSEQGGDGSKSRKQVCKVCSRRWVLVIEVPDSGSDDFAFDTLAVMEE